MRRWRKYFRFLMNEHISWETPEEGLPIGEEEIALEEVVGV